MMTDPTNDTDSAEPDNELLALSVRTIPTSLPSPAPGSNSGQALSHLAETARDYAATHKRPTLRTGSCSSAGAGGKGLMQAGRTPRSWAFISPPPLPAKA